MSQRVKPVAPRLANMPLNQGIVLDCALWEGSGQQTYDLKNKVVGTFTGSPTWANDSLGRALKFSGGQSVSFPDSDQLSFVNGFSMSAWIKPNNTSPNNTIISKRSAFTSTGIPFEVTKDMATISFRVIGSSNIASSGSVITANLWYHVSCTWNQGQGSKVYVNGAIVATATPTGPITDNATSVFIGTLPSAAEQFSGLIDGVKVWNRALSYSEVLSMYADPFVNYIRPRQDFYNSISVPGSPATQLLSMTGAG